MPFSDTISQKIDTSSEISSFFEYSFTSPPDAHSESMRPITLLFANSCLNSLTKMIQASIPSWLICDFLGGHFDISFSWISREKYTGATLHQQKITPPVIDFPDTLAFPLIHSPSPELASVKKNASEFSLFPESIDLGLP